jgi:uncharacterized protein
MFIFDYISSREVEFSKLCSKNHISKLYAFGSSVSNKFEAENSDIDLLVEINEPDPIIKGSLLLDFSPISRSRIKYWRKTLNVLKC